MGLFQIKDYEKLDSEEERLSRSRQIYDGYIMKELLSCSHVRTTHSLMHPGSSTYRDTEHTPGGMRSASNALFPPFGSNGSQDQSGGCDRTDRQEKHIPLEKKSLFFFDLCFFFNGHVTLQHGTSLTRCRWINIQASTAQD